MTQTCNLPWGRPGRPSFSVVCRGKLPAGLVPQTLVCALRGARRQPATSQFGVRQPSLQLKYSEAILQDVSETTRLLRAWSDGDQAALDQLTPRVYDELRRVAGRFMKNENPGRTIQATALVHEAFLRLIEIENVDWQHRAHFFAVAAKIMRQILLDAARKRKTAKRGGDSPHLNLEDLPQIGADRSEQLIALNDALNRLAETDPRKARVVELRFFVGLTVEETAAVLNVSHETVMRDWRLSRAWLMAELNSY